MPTSPRKPATECYGVAHQTQTVMRNPRSQQQKQNCCPKQWRTPKCWKYSSCNI